MLSRTRKRGCCVPRRPIPLVLVIALLAGGVGPCAQGQQFQPPLFQVPPAVEVVSPRVTGNPFLRVWRPEEYNAAPGNTCVVQEPATGIIYVGNSDGVLKYDGARWRLIPLPDGGGVLSMATDPEGRLWIAAETGVARLEADERGVAHAVAVDGVMPKGESGPLSVLASADAVWFQFGQHIVRVGAGNRRDVWNTSERFGNMWWMEDAMHTVIADRDVVRLEAEGKFTVVLKREQLRVAPIRASPLEVFASRQTSPEEWLLLTALGPVRWNTVAHTWRPMPLQPPLFRDTEAIAATFLQGGAMAFTGPRGGVAFFSPQGRLERLLDRMPPVVGPRILNLTEDRDGGLWIAARDRIARVQLRSGFSRHETPQGITSSPNQMLRFGPNLFLAHSEGISRHIEWPGVFPTGEGLRQGADALAIVGDRLMAAAGGLVEVYDDIRFQRWSNEAITTLATVRHGPDVILAGDRQGVWVFRNANGEWKREGRLQQPDTGVITLFDGGDGWVWGATADGRLWRGDFREGVRLDAPVKYFGVDQGVIAPPRGGKVSFFHLGDSVVAATARWLLKHEWGGDFFHPDPRVGGVPSARVGPEAVAVNDDGTFWFRLGDPDRRLLHVVPDGPDHWRTIGLPAAAIRDMPAVGLYEDRGTLWILGKDQLISADLGWQTVRSIPPMPRVRRVIADDGEVLWADGAPISNRPIAIPAGHSSVRFELSTNSYVPDYLGRSFIQYRTQLVGLDPDWTPWSPEPWRDFSQLPHGRYRLRVQAGEAPVGDNPETSFAILVPTPWWLTPWSWFAYVVFALGAVWGIVTLRTHALRQRAVQLEAIVATRTDELRRSNAELARLHRLELDEKIAARLGEEKARLEVLRYQLNPHFLYNALNSIYGLVLTTPRAAADMVLRLADFCRATLTRTEGDRCTVSECFERLSLYLNIEKVRWKESLHVEMLVAEEARDVRIPPFLLQPLVENAIKYGGSTSPEELFVRLSAKIDPTPPAAGRWLVLEVANTGEWIEPSVARAQGNTGLGLANLQERLKRTFPGAHELTTKPADGWVVVRIRLKLSDTDRRVPEEQEIQNPS
jgi:hypothetical protein